MAPPIQGLSWFVLFILIGFSYRLERNIFCQGSILPSSVVFRDDCFQFLTKKISLRQLFEKRSPSVKGHEWTKLHQGTPTEGKESVKLASLY
jgi:hypothetical protein